MTYSPLVIDEHSKPAITPVVPKIPRGSVVGIFGGSNDDRTIIVGDDTCDQTQGQVFFCNTVALFSSVNSAHIHIPVLGKQIDGTPCPTVRSFQIGDQDPSDNVTTTYLATTDGRTAQDTTTNRTILQNYRVLANPSDNRVLTVAVDPVIGCTPWRISDIEDSGKYLPTQATDELQAAAYQKEPIALVPLGDPMVGNNVDILSKYRMSVDQPIMVRTSTAYYCKHMVPIQSKFIQKYMSKFMFAMSPVMGFANLYDFLNQRLIASQLILGC